jgi:hypothetical protein
LEKIVFSPYGRKNNHFFLRKQKFASEFFCPWHNVSSQKEHILCSAPKWRVAIVAKQRAPMVKPARV